MVCRSLLVNEKGVALAGNTVWNVARTISLCAFPILFAVAPAAQSPFSGSYPLLDEEVIHYKSTPPNDLVARLQRRLDDGKATLTFEKPNGYLLSVLRQLHVVPSSQLLVFSKTGFQQNLISPTTPRALYFSDSVYVGWVKGGEVLEVASVDPKQGTMFYTLDQRLTPKPSFVRREECLQCHASPKTVGVPGLLMRSVFPAANGAPQLQAGSFFTDQSSPLKERWGGWYVTGTHGVQRHMGNVWSKENAHPDRLDTQAGANVTSLTGRFDGSAYPAMHSDLVALMVLAHQTHLHNLISRVNWEVRIALSQQATLNTPVGASSETWSDSTRNHLHDSVEALLRCMLFTDEAKLEAPIQGTTEFSKVFVSAGPKDRAGRSLRDLDLKRRMFRYPCSYLIYSEAFDSLPRPALDYYYHRLWDILTGKAQEPDYADLSRVDRKAILSILRQTKTSLPSYWRAAKSASR